MSEKIDHAEAMKFLAQETREFFDIMGFTPDVETDIALLFKPKRRRDVLQGVRSELLNLSPSDLYAVWMMLEALTYENRVAKNAAAEARGAVAEAQGVLREAKASREKQIEQKFGSLGRNPKLPS